MSSLHTDGYHPSDLRPQEKENLVVKARRRYQPIRHTYKPAVEPLAPRIDDTHTGELSLHTATQKSLRNTIKQNRGEPLIEKSNGAVKRKHGQRKRKAIIKYSAKSKGRESIESTRRAAVTATTQTYVSGGPDRPATEAGASQRQDPAGPPPTRVAAQPRNLWS